MSTEEEVLLKISGDASSALDALNRIISAVKGVGGETQKASREAGALDRINQSFNQMKAAIGGIAAASGLVKVVGQIKALGDQAIQSAAAMQSLRIGIETLAAKEMVSAGQFETVSDALGAASGKADELMDWLRELSVISPFEYTQVADTFRMMMAFGATSDSAKDLTAAVLDTGAGLGLMGGQLDRLSYNFGQIISTGRITARDLRDLNMVGLDLAEVFSSSLGKSVEEVNQALETGAMTAEDVSKAFADYAAKNFGGAAERMSTSFEGLKSSIEDVFFFAGADMLGPLLEKVTGILSGLMDKASALLDSGVLKKIGEFLATPVGMALVGVIGAVVAAVVGLGGALGTVVALFPLLTSAASALGAVFAAISGMLVPILAVVTALIPPLIALVSAIGVVVVVGKLLAKAWKENWGGIRAAVTKTWVIIQPMIEKLIALVQSWGQKLGIQVRRVVASLKELFGIRDSIEPVFERISQLIHSINWSDMFATLSDALNVAGSLISSFLNTINRLMRGEGLRAFSGLEDAAIDGLTLVALVFDKYIKKALTWGYNLIVQVANGISRAAQSVLVKVMQFIGNTMARFLAPGSPPKEGPLSNIVKWGKGVINTFLGAFKLADFGLMRDALAPAQQALESALQAGDIDEADFAQIFGQVREQVAGVIAAFRETGEISEEALGQIADTLGEGGEEYVKFLKLQLQHQKALDRLKDVQEEVAKAEAKGFIPAALKEKLKAAEEEANATKDAVDWQREYLAMQQESIDLQLRLIQALEKVGEALGGAAGTETGTGGLAEAMGLEEFAGAAGGVTDAMGAIQARLGEMTPEFEAMRGRVVEWVNALTEWMALPFDQKMLDLAQRLSDVTGIDFVGFLEEVIDTIEQIDEEGLLSVVSEWIGKGLDYIAENLPYWAETVGGNLNEMFASAVDNVSRLIEEQKTKLGTWFGTVIDKFVAWAENQRQSWGQMLKEALALAWHVFIGLVLALIPQHVQDLVSWMGSVFSGFVSDVLDKIGEWVDGLKAIGSVIVSKIKSGLGEAWDMVSHIGGLLSSIGTSILDGDWLANFKSVGVAIVQMIKDGIKSVWDHFISWLLDNLGDISDLLPWSEPKDRRSPLRRLAKSGRALVDNFAAGVSFSPVLSGLRGGLLSVRQMMDGAGAGGNISINQTFEGGLNFPGVRDGRDALGVRRGLQQMALEASMVGRTQVGGV